MKSEGRGKSMGHVDRDKPIIPEPVPPRAVPRHDDDATLVEELAHADFEGPLWDASLNALMEYAWPRLHSKIYNGDIDQVVTGFRHPVLRADLRQLLKDSVDHRDELVVEALIWAKTKFREHLQAGRWDPARGKSLRSYFFGTAASGFWEAYRGWARQQDQDRQAFSRFGPPHEDHEDASSVDLELAHGRREALQRIMNEADDWQHAICSAIFEGQTQVQVAAELHLSARAVEVRMRALRKKARRLVRTGQVDSTLVPRRRRRTEQPTLPTAREPA